MQSTLKFVFLPVVVVVVVVVVLCLKFWQQNLAVKG